MIDISVVIVNYNVKEFVYNLINSLEKARKKLSLEIFVIDNASVDGSVEFLQSRFNDKIVLISSTENLGYGKAANIGFAKAKGKYVLLINPDTLIKEDTLQVLFEFMESHPEAGMAGCKLLNPDGTFAIDSRHSIPSVSSALWRVMGLSNIFPKSKIFGDYNLTWMDENIQSPVPAVSAAFMFCRTEDIHKLGGFDEQFFMFCEDIDLCKRMNDNNRVIYYIPETTVIHYKGESTKRNSIDHVRNHGKSLNQFFNKYYGHSYSKFFRIFVKFGIGIRALFL
ncbi:MAG: glycosyltransferase family 2 protein, partial [Candidatus Heimdallarchaeota archaeon]|nr:glycosyltransferase family 2 protein [Candidatus Heimdallarchaeota archaeon]